MDMRSIFEKHYFKYLSLLSSCKLSDQVSECRGALYELLAFSCDVHIISLEEYKESFDRVSRMCQLQLDGCMMDS